HSRKRVVVGYCVQWVTFGRLHVQNIAVHPQHRRCGLARYLLEDAFEAGRRAGCTKVLLEVRDSNVPARRLYASLRFREVGRRKGYYAQPIEDAILYEKDLVSSRET
ncbi:MAG: ribosomal protein S18-alanine N-acetyltransferase, partial [Acidobacteriota bacterium]